MGASRALSGQIGPTPDGSSHPGRTIPQRRPDATARRRWRFPAPLAGLLALLALLVAATPGPALAQGGDQGGAFTAHDVPIEASAASAAEARDKAIAAGQVKAFRSMLERITDGADHARLPQPPDDRVRAMVETYSLANERTTDTTYKAAITVRYDGAAVRRLLQGQGIGHASGAAQPVLVLPVWQGAPDAPPQLWEDTNPWLMAWRRQEAGNVLMPLEVPTGDLLDVTTVSAAEALAPDSAALETLLDRYDRTQVLVAHGIRTAPDTVAVGLTYGSPRALAQAGQRTIERRQGEAEDAFLTRVATELAGRMEGDWRTATMVETGAARTATALVTLSGFEDWMRIRAALDRSPLIRDYAVQAMTRNRAQLRLTALGEPARVAEALRTEGLSLSEQGGYWMIERAGTGYRSDSANGTDRGYGIEPDTAPNGDVRGLQLPPGYNTSGPSQ